MGSYLLMGDIHLSDVAPASCFDTYQDDIFDLLHQTTLIAADRDVTAVIWAGDIFHHKAPMRTRHGTVRRLIELAGAYPCPVLCVAGNHDITNDRLASIDESQPLGVVFASGAVHRLDGWSALDAGVVPDPVYGVPWLGRFDDDTVHDALAGFRDGDRDNPGLVVAHAPLYPPGLELEWENYKAAAWAERMNNQGSVYYGHVHEAAGIFTTGGVTFCNPGALSRGSLHEHNLTRKVSGAIWDAATGGFEIVEIPHKPSEQVFRLEEISATKAAQVNLDNFLTSIGEVKIRITSVEAVMTHVRGLGLGPELENVVRELLEGVK